MKNLIYLSYGPGLHEEEITFSVLSAYRWLGTSRPDCRIVVYTDRPESFSTLEVATFGLDASTLKEWAGPAGFGHRRKILALRDALQRFDGPSAILDGDTYFRRSPRKLFDRIGPGRAVMHLREGNMDFLPGPVHAELAALLRSSEQWTDLSGAALPISASAPMWNSGVIGADPSDIHAIDEVIHLTDQLCSRSKLHTLEQFALGTVLGRETRLREVGDIVFHYWDRSYRDPFHRMLPALLERTASVPLAERARQCYAYRLRPSLRGHCRAFYNRLVRSIGLLPPVMRSSGR
jgi:hypothetical protein